MLLAILKHAILLGKIDVTTVAEALCETFTRLGLPEEILSKILSDQGSNFTSNLMKKVMELLQIHHLKTSPTTLKQMERWNAFMAL